MSQCAMKLSRADPKVYPGRAPDASTEPPRACAAAAAAALATQSADSAKDDAAGFRDAAAQWCPGPCEPAPLSCERREKGVRVLLALDDSCLGASREAFQFVCSRMLDLDRDVLLIAHCRPSSLQAPTSEGLYSCVKRANDEERRSIENSKAVLGEFHCLAGRARLNYFRLLALKGDIREKMVECARQEAVDFVVVGSKARAQGGILTPLLHSTSLSDYCLKHCACPVLVVRESPQSRCQSPVR